MLPNNIASYRKAAGMTQQALADAIGTTRNMLAKLESGSRDLTSDWLEKIGQAVGVEPYLLIAPDTLIPSESELEQLIADAQQRLPAGLPYSEWPRAVASELRTRLRLPAGDRASAHA